MSVERIAALRNAQKEMDKMYEKTFENKEIKEDLYTLHKKAIMQIGSYLTDVSKALNGKWVTVEIPQNIYSSYSRTARIGFNVKASCYAHEEAVLNWAMTTEYFSETSNYWKIYYGINNETVDQCLNEDNRDSYKLQIAVIENWSEIKEVITSKIEAVIKKEMEEKQKLAVAKNEEYLKAANFQI